MSSSPKVWLVTGSASGLGRHIVETALAAGERVVASARNPRRLDDLVAQYGDQVRTFSLDVTDMQAAQAAVQFTVDAFGRLDVLVNNAGFGHVSPFEQASEADFRAQIDTNFYGVVNLTRAAVPVMRAQRAGHILHVSSVGGRTGTPGLSAYQAAKWAVGGFTEALAQEVGPLGIQVTALEPGGMRTGWGVEARSAVPELLPEYQSSVGAFNEMLRPYIGNEAGDPAKVAAVILELTRHDKLPAHLLLGSDALQYAAMADTRRAADAEQWRSVSTSTDFANAGASPMLSKE